MASELPSDITFDVHGHKFHLHKVFSHCISNIPESQSLYHHSYAHHLLYASCIENVGSNTQYSSSDTINIFHRQVLVSF